jgi:two-component system, OmpR family, phosphate regulon sensor histidine kinase PhoR
MEPAHLLILAAIAAAAVAVVMLVQRERELTALRAVHAASVTSPPRSRGALDPEDVLHMADWLSIGLLRVDADGLVIMANEAAHRFLDRRPGSLVGLSTIEAFVDHRIEELVRQAASAGTARRELTFGGEPPPTLVVHARRVRSDGGVWMILEDVSELRRLQRIRAEFIDNLSHELRTPLTTVRLLTESLAMELEREELPPRVREAITKIDVETGHLAQMVTELLDLARIEQGETPLRADEVDLGGVVERTIERLHLYAERHGVRLRAEVPPDAAGRSVRGDEERLGQVLVNLVDNAVKFSTAGDEVVVRLRPGESEVSLEVEDTGIGIPHVEQDRIFERFYKVDRARQRDRGGTGLGLAIARHIVERHGGRISVVSSEGQGSRFVVTLPSAPASGGDAA